MGLPDAFAGTHRGRRPVRFSRYLISRPETYLLRRRGVAPSIGFFKVPGASFKVPRPALRRWMSGSASGCGRPNHSLRAVALAHIVIRGFLSAPENHGDHAGGYCRIASALGDFCDGFLRCLRFGLSGARLFGWHRAQRSWLARWATSRDGRDPRQRQRLSGDSDRQAGAPFYMSIRASSTELSGRG